MNAMFWIIIIATVAVGVGLGLYARKENNKLLESGLIIKRDLSFMEKENTFTTKAAFMDFFTQFEKHKVENSGISYSGNKQQGRLEFKCSDWKAVLYRTKDAEPFQYVFHFTSWGTTKGVANGITSMNILLTAVEKAFLETDSGTQVARTKMEMKTKTSFF